LSCELKYENKTYIITNVYCPNDSGVRKTFIRDIDPYVTDGSLTEKMPPQFQLLSHPPELFHKFCHDSISENVQCVS
jgi:hypothetical protein